MRYQTLAEWLSWQESLHFTDIDPGLERISHVWQNMGGSARLPFPVITVAGTNGKGSSVAMLSTILRFAGYKTASYTSPHLLRYNERICIDGSPVSDSALCQAFQEIDHCRGEVSLTYFEFATLAAATLFCQQEVDIAILEVGMGGRLDAVNIFDTDIALITPISLDHTQWLGQTREQIGLEKAGIITQGQPVVFSEAPPTAVLSFAQNIASCVYQAEQDYYWRSDGTTWTWRNAKQTLPQLPLPALEGTYQLQNAAAVLQVVTLLADQGIPVLRQHIEQGLSNVTLAGRFQRIPGEIEVIVDVTHNQHGACNLRDLLIHNAIQGKTFAVVGMLKDKDITSVAATMADQIDGWYVGTLTSERGQTAAMLAKQMASSVTGPITIADSIEKAYQQARQKAQRGDRIVVFGSFQTVECVLRLLECAAD